MSHLIFIELFTNPLPDAAFWHVPPFSWIFSLEGDLVFIWRPLALLFTLFWILILVKLVRYRPTGAAAPARLGKSLIGLFVLVPAWGSLWVVHGLYEDGPHLLLYLMVLIWVADSGAYFAGRRWGRVKLAPVISPGKTREGVYGAVWGRRYCFKISVPLASLA